MSPAGSNSNVLLVSPSIMIYQIKAARVKLFSVSTIQINIDFELFFDNIEPSKEGLFPLKDRVLKSILKLLLCHNV